MSLFPFDGARSSINDHEAAARPQGLKYMIEHPFRSAEFVIRVTDQHRVHGARWQARIVRGSKDHIKVVIAPQQGPRPQEEQGQFTEIHGKNLTPLTDGRRKLEREVPCSRTEVDDGISILQVQRSKNVRWPLPLVALRLYNVEPLERICKRVQGVQSQEHHNRTN